MKCDEGLLETLVSQSFDPDGDVDAIASHLETCVRCQQTLADLGGRDCWWQDARQWLSIPADGVVPAATNTFAPPIDLRFLETPTHPEMLGRIGRYEVESVLGRGGMGVVLRAHDSDLHRTVAIKVLAPEWAASIPARRRFAREAQAAASVAHENVIPIYNVEADAALPFLVMRYVPGMTLQRWVMTNGVPDAATILRVAGQLADGLAAAHRRGLVHRDIKPGNVMVGENNDRVWLTDFGLARAADSVTLTQTGIIAGTPNYMSPEQARGENVDHQSDLFSLGCLLYFLATGRPPFESENTLAVLHRIVCDDAEPLASLRNDLPPEFVRLVHRLLLRQPTKRPADCDAVMDALQIAQTELDAGRRAKPPMNPRVRQWLFATGLAGCLAGIVAVTVLKFSIDSPRKLAVSTQDSKIAVSPYLAQAAERIESSAWIDIQQWHQRVQSTQREVERMQIVDPAVSVPGIQLSDREWQAEVDRLQRLIEQSKRR